MAKERRKIVVAGPFWSGCQYRANMSRDPAQRRNAKMHISTPAQSSINVKYSYEKLLMLLLCNFSPEDLVVELTYRDEDLPPNRDAADKRAKLFIRRLRALRKAKDASILYIWNTEKESSDSKRLHHHVVVNSTGLDYKAIRECWRLDGDNVHFKTIRDWGYDELARYITKEPREYRTPRVGERSWKASINMKRPEVIYSYVDETDPLTIPPGLTKVSSDSSDNVFGRFVSIRAIRKDVADCFKFKTK